VKEQSRWLHGGDEKGDAIEQQQRKERRICWIVALFSLAGELLARFR
jgi:hypothetical protein